MGPWGPHGNGRQWHRDEPGGRPFDRERGSERGDGERDGTGRCLGGGAGDGRT